MERELPYRPASRLCVATSEIALQRVISAMFHDRRAGYASSTAGAGHSAGALIGAIGGNAGLGAAIGAGAGVLGGFLYGEHQKSEQDAYERGMQEGYRRAQ